MKRPSNLLSPVLAFVTASVFPLAVTGADNPPALQPVVTDTTSANKPPMVTQNPDGTMTVQREVAEGGTEDNEKKGLVIPLRWSLPRYHPLNTNNEVRFSYRTLVATGR